MARTDTSRHDAAAREEARAEALRNSDNLAEWLTGECYCAPVSDWQPVLKDKTAADFAGWSVNDLLALLMDCGQPMATTRAVRDALAEHYVAQPNVAARINDRAAAIALRMVEDERFPEAA